MVELSFAAKINSRCSNFLCGSFWIPSSSNQCGRLLLATMWWSVEEELPKLVWYTKLFWIVHLNNVWHHGMGKRSENSSACAICWSAATPNKYFSCKTRSAMMIVAFDIIATMWQCKQANFHSSETVRSVLRKSCPPKVSLRNSNRESLLFEWKGCQISALSRQARQHGANNLLLCLEKEDNSNQQLQKTREGD